MSLTGLYWLTDEFQVVADLPGRWRADADAAYVEGIEGTERLQPTEGAPGLLVEAGDRRIEVIRRTGSVALRVHDPKSPHLKAYNGIPTYAPSGERWRVSGTFTPYEQDRTVTTGAVVEGLEHHHNCRRRHRLRIGAVRASQLVTFGGPSTGGLRVMFTDATSGVTTYPGVRSISIDATRCRRKSDSRLQPCVEPAVRVHRLRNLPGGTRGEPAPHCCRSGREEPALSQCGAAQNPLVLECRWGAAHRDQGGQSARAL